MKIEHGAPVVAEIRGDEVQWTRLHVAVPSKKIRHRDGFPLREHYLGAYKSPPLEWASLCGLSGLLLCFGYYVRDLGVPFCSVCLGRVNRDLDGFATSWSVEDAQRRRERRRLRVAAAFATSPRLHEERIATIAA